MDIASSIASAINKYSIIIALIIVFGYLIWFFSKLFIKIKEQREKEKSKKLKELSKEVKPQEEIK